MPIIDVIQQIKVLYSLGNATTCNGSIPNWVCTECILFRKCGPTTNSRQQALYEFTEGYTEERLFELAL